nr:MAG TPA: hypothetical protein [Caudoviricetes sp.]
MLLYSFIKAPVSLCLNTANLSVCFMLFPSFFN